MSGYLLLSSTSSPGLVSSLGLECGRLFVVEVLCASFELVPLLLLGRTGARSDVSELSLVLAVSKNLLAAEVLLLHGPEALLFFLCFLCHVCLFQLQVALEHHGVLLLLVESLEVVRFDTVRSEHGLFSLGILGHEIVVVGVVNISAGLQLLVVAGSNVSVSLLLRHLGVRIFGCHLHGQTLISVHLLSLLKQVVEVLGLVVVGIIGEFLLLFVEVSLANLLIDPVALL